MDQTTRVTGGDSAADLYRNALRRLRPMVLGVLAVSAILNVLMLTGSVYMLQVYDRVLASGSVPTLLGLFAIVVVLMGFLGFYDFLRARLLSRGAMQLDRAAADAAFRAGPGQGAGRPLQDLATVRGFLSGPAVAAVFDLPFVPLYLGLLFVLHPWLGWATVAGAGVVAGLALLNRLLTTAPTGRAAVLDATARTLAESRQWNGEMIRAMGMEPAVALHWRKAHDAALAAGQEGSDPAEALAAASRAFRMLLQSAILTLGALLVIRGDISGGMIIASSILSGRALGPLDQIIGQWRAIGRATEAHRRMRAFSAAFPAETAPLDLPAPQGRVEIRGLSRLMPARPGGGTERPAILSDIAFALEPGEALGVIGASASGKSTLARLLVGALDADAGDVRLDGATLDQYPPAARARHVGYLPQRVEMLPGSVRDNIARFDAHARDIDVVEAARATGVHEMILKLPQGYATVLGGADQPLSGGQVQRIGLARALFRMPALVVLDEPNSNLDGAGEAALTQAIETLRAAGSAVVVMAHRAAALAAVDKLLVLEAGRIAAFGPKAEVLALAANTGIAPVASKGAGVPVAPTAPAPATISPVVLRPVNGPVPHVVRRAVPPTPPAGVPDAAQRQSA